MSEISTDLTSYERDVGSKKNNKSLKIPDKYKRDYDLVQKILSGDEKAWNNFITKTQDFLYFTIKKIIAKTNLDSKAKRKANELVDDLFLDFYEHLLKNDCHLLSVYKGNSKLSSYLYVCLNNFVYDFFKSKRWKSYLKEINASELGSFGSDSGESESTISEIVDRFSAEKTNNNFNPEKEMFKKEIMDIIDELVSELSEKEQLCFNLLFIDGLKPSEASLILGVTSFEVSQIKYRIKEKLKKSGKEKVKEFLDDN
jgi:RNA polymerase sigma factor (sigma-70 family)